MWSNTTFHLVAEASLKIVNPKTNVTKNVKFIVVKNCFNCLLGLNIVLNMDLVIINHSVFLLNKDSSTNSELGDVGTVTLCVDNNVKLRISPCRNFSILMRDRVKYEIDYLVKI